MGTLPKHKYVIECDVIEWCAITAQLAHACIWYNNCLDQARKDGNDNAIKYFTALLKEGNDIHNKLTAIKYQDYA